MDPISPGGCDAMTGIANHRYDPMVALIRRYVRLHNRYDPTTGRYVPIVDRNQKVIFRSTKVAKPKRIATDLVQMQGGYHAALYCFLQNQTSWTKLQSDAVHVKLCFRIS